MDIFVLNTGFGHIVPRTNLGKMLTMVLSIIGIPFQVALFALEGEIINNAIGSILTTFEVGFLRRTEVKHKARKQLIATIMLTIVVWTLWAMYLKFHEGDHSFLDCMYYVFQVITTIGYGDIVIVPALSAYDIVSQSFTGILGMSTMASLISSACSFIQSVNAKQALRRVSFSKTKAWSLSRIDAEDQKIHSAKELFRFYEGRERSEDLFKHGKRSTTQNNYE